MTKTSAMDRFILVLFFTIFGTYPSFANSCIDPKDQSVPLCPVGKTSGLDDTYPAAFVTVGPGIRDAMGLRVLTQAIQADPKTKFVLSGWSPKQIADARDALSRMGISENELNDRLINFKAGTALQWQQDFVQPEFDSATGAPVIRPIGNYLHARVAGTDDQAYFDSLTKLLNDQKVFCSDKVLKGPRLGADIENASGFGGNLETFPGGLCLVGNDLPKESFADFCKGKEEFAIRVPVNSLRVGHVDELVSIVKDTTAKAPCNFALLRASPAKALELLKASGSELFQNLPKSDVPEYTSDEVYDSWTNYKKKNPDVPEIPAQSEPKTLKGTNSFIKFLMHEAFAETNDSRKAIYSHRSEVGSLTNLEAYYGITKNHDLADFNSLIEAQMAETERLIKQKARDMGCPDMKAVAVPSLFKGNVIPTVTNPLNPKVEVTFPDGKKTNKLVSEYTQDEMNAMSPVERMKAFKYRLQPGSGVSINPNPTNALLIDKTILLPEQKNEAFDRYLTKELSVLGLTPKTVDTWASGQTQLGNVHCSTNAFRYCRPI